MNNKEFQTYFDCGFSKIRAGTFNKNNQSEAFYAESKFFTDHAGLNSEIQKIIVSFEKDTSEYVNNINLMIDNPKMLSIGVSMFKKLDGSKLKKANVQFLIQEAKQQILRYYKNYNIAHIIINNYKIDNVDYSYLPDEKKCHSISLDILFICLPSDLVEYYKKIFSKSNISIDQIICSCYAKAMNYIDNLNLNGYVSLIDVGFNKTSIISCYNNKVLSLVALPIGGNHITKDISKILKINLEKSEQIKLNFNRNNKLSDNDHFSLETLKKIIFARTEEILELCAKSVKSNVQILGDFKMILMGGGSKILNSDYMDKISFTNEVDFIEESIEDICQSGFKFGMGINKQEVVIVPKKQTKQGFFERFFHIFK